MRISRQWAVVDAFSDHAFSGNPAGVLQLTGHDDVGDDVLQAVAAEAALSETAFVVPRGEGRYGLRWFTPTNEVALCGHATLATAHLLLERDPGLDEVVFDTASGELRASRVDDRVRIDLPRLDPSPLDDDGLRREATLALGVQPEDVLETGHDDPRERNLLAVLSSETEVRDLAPDLDAVAALPVGGVIVTAPADADDVDVVSRYFTPQHGIPEDPVTGSAHCTVGPYWCDRLGVDELRAVQASERGGRLLVRPDGDRVHLVGAAVTVVEGELTLP